MSNDSYTEFVRFVRDWYGTDGTIPLHEPRFYGNEDKYVRETLRSTFVSSVGKYVDRFEQDVAEYTGADYTIATVNGTAALHIALIILGAKDNCEVITPSLTFVGTANAISYTGALPVFVDIDRRTLGMSAKSLEEYLAARAEPGEDGCFNKHTGRRIVACLPVHIFGHPVEIDKIVNVCDRYNLPVLEDAAESLGSFHQERHSGTFGRLGVLSFNGNKIVTTGGGGMIITNDEELAKTAKHLTTTAKIPHRWHYRHDTVAYNYRMPNLNAALGCAQLENLDVFLEDKRQLAHAYQEWFSGADIDFVTEPRECRSNYWLNTIVLAEEAARDRFLEVTNDAGILTRPCWTPMHNLPMFEQSDYLELGVTDELARRLMNIPSSALDSRKRVHSGKG